MNLQDLIKKVGDNRVYLSGKPQSELTVFCITEYSDILFIDELTDDDNIVELVFDDFYVGTLDQWKISVKARVADRKSARKACDKAWDDLANCDPNDVFGILTETPNATKSMVW